MRKLLILTSLLVLIAVQSVFALPMFNGSLSTPGGIDGTGVWGEDLKFEWWVEQQMDNSWLYKYHITDTDGDALAKAVSHWYVEVSPNVTENDFWGFGGSWEFVSETHGGTSFPNAMKLDYGSEGQIEWSFYSTRAPVWGDFYLKDGVDPAAGVQLYAWNAGFNDPDPLNSPQNGSIANKILRPDTLTGIPEPTTLGLLGLGLLGFASRRFLKK